MLNYEVFDADVHDFDIQHSLIAIRYLAVVKTGFYPVPYVCNIGIAQQCNAPIFSNIKK
jgi:hypothetical protein